MLFGVQNRVISPTKTNYLAAFKITDTVNVYPQAINRDCCDKNHHSGVQTQWDTQIISQPSWAIPANKIRHFYFPISTFSYFNLTPDSRIRYGA
jgi:hypothetical protein